MQSQTKPPNGSQANGVNRKYLLVGFFFAVVLLFFTIRSRTSVPRQAPQNSGVYLDEGSGETVSDPEGKSPEIFGDSSRQIVFLGFSKLLDHGITQYQLDAAKTALKIHSRERGEKITEASIYVDTVRRVDFDRDDPDPTRRLLFDIMLNRKDNYQAILQYVSIRSAQLILTQDGKEIFRSQMIDPDGYTDEGEEAGDVYLQPEDR